MDFQRHGIRDVDLRIARLSAGDRPTVVMTNAFPQSIRCWESLWDRLAEHVDVLAVDLAGFGHSTGCGAIMRPSAQAELLIELLDALGIDAVFLVGPDVGVPVTLSLAAAHPERVLGVNIFDGPATWPTDFDPALRAATRSRLGRWLGIRPPLRRRLMKQNFEVATSDGYRHFMPSDAAIEEYRAICFDAERHQNAFGFLGSYAERLHALLPNSELKVFDDAGHFSHEDADDRWLHRFLAFIKTNRTDPSTHPSRGAISEPIPMHHPSRQQRRPTP